MSDLLAEMVGDYVLGVLDGEEVRDFEAALRRDAALRAQVDRFRSRMTALDETVEPLPVSSALWEKIDSRISGGSQTATILPLRRRPAIGQIAAIAASLVVAAGLGFIAGRSVEAPREQPLVIAVLLTDGAEPGAIIEAFANNRVHIRPLEDFLVPEGKILEVWTKPSEEIGPVSLGRFLKSEDLVLEGVALPTPQSGQLYEITLEDAPGSPTGKPTGPILVKGFARLPVI